MKLVIRINPSFCIVGALALLLIPTRWLLAAVFAAAVHEGGHLLALKLLRVPVAGICVSAGGAQIETAPMRGREELIAALAGPMAGLLLVALARWLPYTALCAAVQSAYNLLPVGHQDGSRILRCILMPVAGERTEGICTAAEVMVGGILLLGAIRLGMGLLPVLLFGVCLSEKFLANLQDRRYNRANYG